MLIKHIHVDLEVVLSQAINLSHVRNATQGWNPTQSLTFLA
jgi:hypothetical protein